MLPFVLRLGCRISLVVQIPVVSRGEEKCLGLERMMKCQCMESCWKDVSGAASLSQLSRDLISCFLSMGVMIPAEPDSRARIM